jgi:predicted MFS family arabinose efflux permease
LIAPGLAGLLIAAFVVKSVAGTAEAAPDQTGIGLTFGLVALAMLVSWLALALIRARREQPPGKSENPLSTLREGVVYIWNDPPLLILCIAFLVAGAAFTGPFFIGVPVLANARLPEGAAAFGLIMSAFGGGATIGTILSGILPKPAPQRIAMIVILCMTLNSTMLAVFGMTIITPLLALAAFIIGVSVGYFFNLFITWVQIRTEPEMIGRVLGVVSFALFGHAPLTYAIAGAWAHANLETLFIIPGLGGAIILAYLASRPEIRNEAGVPAPVDVAIPAG